jgi:glyoxylase-like metal-dependent hydrolase (beta-lactamase superfamily II)
MALPVTLKEKNFLAANPTFFMEISRIKLNLPIKSPEFSNVYVICDGGEVYVIDGGFISEKHAIEITEKLESFGLSLSSSRFLITHHHIDHVGIVIWKKVNAFMHPLEIPFLKLYTDPSYFARPYLEWSRKYGIDMELLKPLISFFKTSRRAETSYSTGVRIETKGNISPLEDGEVLSYLRVIHTPGHCPGHLSFYIPSEKVIFSGDLILSVTTTHVGYYPGYSPDPVGDHVKNLRKLLELEIDVVYPAHEDIIKNPGKRISELIHHYEEREEEVYSAVEGDSRVLDVARKVNWSTGSFDTIDGWGKVLAFSETLAFLKRLVNEGRLREKEIDGVIHYTNF